MHDHCGTNCQKRLALHKAPARRRAGRSKVPFEGEHAPGIGVHGQKQLSQLRWGPKPVSNCSRALRGHRVLSSETSLVPRTWLEDRAQQPRYIWQGQQSLQIRVGRTTQEPKTAKSRPCASHLSSTELKQQTADGSLSRLFLGQKGNLSVTQARRNLAVRSEVRPHKSILAPSGSKVNVDADQSSGPDARLFMDLVGLNRVPQTIPGAPAAAKVCASKTKHGADFSNRRSRSVPNTGPHFLLFHHATGRVGSGLASIGELERSVKDRNLS